MKRVLTALAATLPFAAHAADAITGEVQRQPTNWQAIVMFLIFVVLTLYITYWASKRVRSRSDYYTAGGNITGFQNGLAIAGDFMSAASFLGISALVYTSGYDGLIYSLGFLVGWPIILFLIAERLRNLGRFTFADVASYRLKQGPIRTLSACGSLVVVALYLIAQMVGAGKLIELLFGLNYHVAVVLVGVLMVMYVLFGGMLACMLLAGELVYHRALRGGQFPPIGHRFDHHDHARSACLGGQADQLADRAAAQDRDGGPRAQLRPAAVDAAAHRADLGVQDRRDLLVREPLDVAQDDGDPLLRLERVQGGRDVTVELEIGVQLLRPAGGPPDVVGGGAERVHADALAAAGLVEEKVGGDAMQPTLQRAGLEVLQRRAAGRPARLHREEHQLRHEGGRQPAGPAARGDAARAGRGASGDRHRSALRRGDPVAR